VVGDVKVMAVNEIFADLSKKLLGADLRKRHQRQQYSDLFVVYKDWIRDACTDTTGVSSTGTEERTAVPHRRSQFKVPPPMSNVFLTYIEQLDNENLSKSLAYTIQFPDTPQRPQDKSSKMNPKSKKSV